MQSNRTQLYSKTLEEIRNALSQALITQKEIGDVLGIKQSAVSSLLAGKSSMSLEQFLALSDLAGLRPQSLLQNVQNRITEVVDMSPEIEGTLYRSEIHMLAYCLSAKDMSLADLKLDDVTPSKIEKALQDLVKVGLLVKKGSKFRQLAPQKVYRPSSRALGSQVHLDIVKRSWTLFDKLYANKEFIATKFNAYMVDRFTVAQSKEIEAMLGTVYQKITTFR